MTTTRRKYLTRQEFEAIIDQTIADLTLSKSTFREVAEHRHRGRGMASGPFPTAPAGENYHGSGVNRHDPVGEAVVHAAIQPEHDDRRSMLDYLDALWRLQRSVGKLVGRLPILTDSDRRQMDLDAVGVPCDVCGRLSTRRRRGLCNACDWSLRHTTLSYDAWLLTRQSVVDDVAIELHDDTEDRERLLKHALFNGGVPIHANHAKPISILDCEGDDSL